MMTAKRWSILAMIALLCVTLCTGAAAEETTPLEAAIAKYEAEQYEEALTEFIGLADEGNVKAMAWAGYCMEYGKGTEADAEQAKAYYEKAAAEGDGYSMSHLGSMYYRGKLSEDGSRDYANAMKWGLEAEKAGYGEASMREYIGLMYLHGNGVEKDANEAEIWLRLAAEEGRLEAIHRLGEIYAGRTEIAGHDEIARQWYEKGVELGGAACMYHLGVIMYNEGDEEAGMELLTKAAEEDNAQAIRKLGVIAADKDDFAAAYSWLSKYDEMGMADSDQWVNEMLGWLNANGHAGEEKNYEAAAKYYEKAVELGSGYAMHQIGLMISEGQFYEKDEAKAQEYFDKAKAAGYEE